MLKKIDSTASYLLLIVLLGIFLRIYDLSEESLWMDEIDGGVLTAKQKISYLLNPQINQPINLYDIILHYWIKIFGTSEFAVRFPAMVFGGFTIIFIFKLGRELINREVGLSAAFLLAISPFQIHYSQEARPYSLLMFLSLISIYYYIKFLKSNNKRDVFLYILPTILSIYTHRLIFLLLIFQNIYFLIFKRNFKQHIIWFISQFIIVMTFIFYHPFFIKRINWIMDGDFAYLQHHFSFASIFEALYTFIFGFASIKPDNCLPCFYVNPLIILILGTILGILIFLGIQRLFKKRNSYFDLLKENKTLTFLILYLFIPILLLYLVSLFFPLFQVKYLIYSSTPIYILIGQGISQLKRNYKPRIIGLILVLFILVLGGYYQDSTKDQWKEAIDYINNNSKRNDVIIYPYPIYVFKYYDAKIAAKRVIPDRTYYPEYVSSIDEKPLIISEINQIKFKYERAWIVLPSTWEFEDYRELTNDFEMVISEKKFKGIMIKLFKIK